MFTVVVDQWDLVSDTALSFVATFPRRAIMHQPARECPLPIRTRRTFFERTHDPESIRVDASSLYTHDVEVSRIRTSHDTSLTSIHAFHTLSPSHDFERVAQRSPHFSDIVSYAFVEFRSTRDAEDAYYEMSDVIVIRINLTYSTPFFFFAGMAGASMVIV